MSMKKSSNTIGNLTRDLPVCNGCNHCHRAPHFIINTGVKQCDYVSNEIIYCGAFRKVASTSKDKDDPVTDPGGLGGRYRYSLTHTGPRR
jgi:hypothetical protein